jgi:DinB superfamily
MTDLRYPIGPFVAQDQYSPEEIKGLIHRIETLPTRLEKEVNGLTGEQLDTPYREGGWTVRQVIHHVSDSHMNAYIRLKWTLTESTPTIKAYNEKDWAQTPEVKLDPVISLTLLNALHTKWSSLLKLLSNSDLQKEFLHPESKKFVRLDRQMALYAWHGDHHLAHITSLKSRMGWN